MAGYYLYTKIDREKETIQVEDDETKIKKNINDYVPVETNKYKYNELAGIYDLEVTVTNNTNYLIDNAKVRLTYI